MVVFFRYIIFYFILLFSLLTVSIFSNNAIELIRASNGKYINFSELKDEGIFILKGGVIAKYQSKTLKAEVLKINTKTNEIFGEGEVYISDTKSNNYFKGESFYYNLKKDQGIIYKTKSNIQPFTVNAELIEQLDAEKFYLHKVYFTHCNESKPHYKFKATKIWIYPNNQIIMENLLYIVGDTPIFYFPYIFQTKIGTGILTHYGYTQSRGHYLQNTWYFGFPKWSHHLFVPDTGKLTFDFYQHVGEAYGLYLQDVSKYIKYNIDLGFARYKVKELTCDLTLQANQNCKQIFTNYVNKGDNSFGIVPLFWWKTGFDFKSKWEDSFKTKSTNLLAINILYYNHRNFQPEFAKRIEPQNSLELISYNNVLNTQGPDTLPWKFLFSKNWENVHKKGIYIQMDLEIKRLWRWDPANTEQTSRYRTELDTIPNFNFNFFWPIYTNYKSILSSILWEGNIKTDIQRKLSRGVESKIEYHPNASSNLLFLLSFFRWLNLKPKILYGINYLFITPNNQINILESGKNSYNEFSIETPLQLGIPEVYLKVNYHYSVYFFRTIQDPTFKNQGPHYLDFLFNTDWNNLLLVQVSTQRELRSYGYTVQEHQRWNVLNLKTEVHYDILHGLNKVKSIDTGSKKSYMSLSLTNEYSYFIRYLNHGVNSLHFDFNFGNYKFLYVTEIHRFFIGLGWVHNFLNLALGTIYFKFGFDWLLHQDWKVSFEIRSVADEVERYFQGTSFIQDIINGFIPSRNNNTVFNIDYIKVGLEHKLHKWVLRLEYSRYRNHTLWGSSLENRAVYYEHAVSFGLYLEGFSFLNEDFQVYRNRPNL